MKKNTPLAIAIAAGVVGLAVYLLVPAASGIRHLPASSLAAAPTRVALTSTTPVPTSIAQAQAAPTASASVRALFPEVSYQPTDWRAFATETLVIQPFPDKPALTFTRASTRPEINGNQTSIYRSGVQGSFLAMTAACDHLHAVLETADGSGSVELHIDPAGEATVSVPTQDYTCGVGKDHAAPSQLPAALHPAVAAALDRARGQARLGLATPAATPAVVVTSTGSSAGEEVGIPQAANADTQFIDVSFFVTVEAATFLRGNGSWPSAVTITQSKLAASSACFANSNINAEYRYVGLYEAPAYTRTGLLRDDIAAMGNRATTLGAFVQSKLDDDGADFAVLLFAGAGDAVGRGEMPGRYSAITASLISQVTPLTYLAIAHECGHNLGCGHERDDPNRAINNPTSPVNNPNDGLYNYGVDLGFGTVMRSTIGNTVPYFSNPDITLTNPIDEAGLSHTGTFRLGIPVGQPNASDNARYIRENLARAVNANAPVKITTQPASRSVSRGASFTLTVTAAGLNLNYQWRRDGAVIAGANAASFTVANAADSDAGSYTVTVSNPLLSVQSNAATVTVTAPQPPPPPPTSGGGGGGGAPSLWFLSTLFVALLLRFKK